MSEGRFDGLGSESIARVGVDTGGTFTDFVWAEADGRLKIHKLLSTPVDPSIAVLEGIQFLSLSPRSAVIHGSTVATNALLERRGARTALITTAGFADVLAIGRQNRPDLYALVPRKPEPLVRKEWRFEVTERVTAEGAVLKQLNIDDLEPIIERIAADGIESVAVCLLFSYLWPDHERKIRYAIRQAQSSSILVGDDGTALNMHLSLSSELLPEYREYERTSTTVINAYVAPLMVRYLRRLRDELAPRTLSVMQSNGGIINEAMAGNQAARTVLSGPAGGVVGARFIAEKAGHNNIITFDMGGTSTDVALCPNRLPQTSEGEIVGMPMRLPMLDIHTVGSGGGSLAYIDAGGALRVGPESAGADPGPVCYSKAVKNQRNQPSELNEQREAIGDKERSFNSEDRFSKVTTTDANLILGRLDANHFLGGDMRLDTNAAMEEMNKLAIRMGAVSAEEAAWGVVQVANATMERAIRRISVERGYDPREFTMVAFGGAGPLHACELAESMQIPSVLLPRVPGGLSALGMLVAKPAKDYSITVMRRLEEPSSESNTLIENQFLELERRAVKEMKLEGYSEHMVNLARTLDMRYVGQSHELTISVPPVDSLQAANLLFHAAHEQRYSYARTDSTLEVVNVRVQAVAQTSAPLFRQETKSGSDSNGAIIGRKQVWFGRMPVTSALYQRDLLRAGNRFSGPAVVFQYDSTTIIPPEWRAEVDALGNLILSDSRA